MRVRMAGLRGPRYLTKIKLSGVTASYREGERRRFVCVANTGANEVGGDGTIGQEFHSHTPFSLYVVPIAYSSPYASSA